MVQSFFRDSNREQRGSRVVKQSSRSESCKHLLWIGAPRCRVMRDAYEFAMSCAYAASTRFDLTDAFARPVEHADLVVFAREDRHPIDQDLAEVVLANCPAATWLDLLGPLALGVRASSCSAARRLPVHALREELVHCWGKHASDGNPVHRKSVLLLAASEGDSEPYREMARASSLAFAWARPEHQLRFCHADIYWWDDSVATPVDQSAWSERITAADPEGRGLHLWITHSPNQDQEQVALAGGVAKVIRKPYLLDSLVSFGESVELELGGLYRENAA